MGWLNRSNDVHKWNRLQTLLKGSFYKIKTDMSNLLGWVQYLEDKHKHVDERLARLEQYAHVPHNELRKVDDRLRHMEQRLHEPTRAVQQVELRMDKLEGTQGMTASDVKKIVDTHFSFDHIMSRLEAIEQRISGLSKKPTKTNLQQKIVKNVVRNSKDHIKNVILQLIMKYEHVSGLQLKEMVVDEQSLCSKSSFYRLLQEIEREGYIGFLREGKEKRYFSKYDEIAN